MNADAFTVDYVALFDHLCPKSFSNSSSSSSSSLQLSTTSWKLTTSPSGVSGLRHQPLLERLGQHCANFSTIMEYYDYDIDWMTLRPESLIVPLVFGATLLVGLVGNSLVAYVVMCMRAMHSVTNMYLVNLAVADILFLVFCVPFTAAIYIVPYWPFGETMCKVVNFLMMLTMGTSVFTMTAMSFDRYHAVVHPVESKSYRTTRRTAVVLVVIWLTNLLALAPILVISRTFTFWDHGAERDFCLEYFPEPTHRKIYTVGVFIGYYLLPLAAIAMSYGLMARSLWSSVSPAFLQANLARAIRSRRRVTKMVLLIILVFGICWLPIHIIHLHNDLATPRYSTVFYVAKIIAHCMSYINSAVNPIVYGFMSETFRQCFRTVFSCARFKAGRPRIKIVVISDPEALPGSSDEKRMSGSGTGTGSFGQSQSMSVHLSANMSLVSKVSTSESSNVML